MSSSSNLRSEDQFLCSICLDVFTDPVSTPCGHNFCKACITQHWDGNVLYNCPLCKELFTSRPQLKVNTFIKEMVAKFRREAQQEASSSSSSEQQAAKPGEVPCDVCTGTKLKALKSCLVCLLSYCQTHLEPHLTTPGLKKHQVMEPVENLEDRMCLQHDKPLELFCRTDQTCVCLLCSVLDHKNHEFVPLREETEGKKAELRKTEDEVQKMIQNRRVKIQEIKESVKISKDAADHEKFDASYEGTVVRAVAQLEEKIREEMKKMMKAEMKRVQQSAVDVTLDPDTAHPDLILSDDGKQVKHGDVKKNLPDNPERFSKYANVLGRQSFSSGRFYFEVQVKGKTKWTLGVARESINRKGEITVRPQNGYWTIVLRNSNEYSACADFLVRLHLHPAPEKVGVFVDYEEGLVSFYDVDAAALIYSFTGCCFTQKLYPFFCPCLNDGGKNSAPLIICPVNQADG
ncbi:PREDICTED: E3 ubiquitin-protein ligase TRIM21-like [Cyprinodon variegatus]|uniref:E3 ubiquitin-protein ligase TRIM21-like n=1 Tax=Cyprinodon variegatus TaxID=28743 RepID=UPI000742CB51|nr:PREDICTED: E3 ubiquitin-protein ligase TRIM21-like [Cyprinodon variegatus]